MATNLYGDNSNDFNGDPSKNGRVNTKKGGIQEKMQTWMNDTFAEKFLTKFIPDHNFSETFSSPASPGEFKIDTDSNDEGYSSVLLEVSVTPEFYSYMENSGDGWEKMIKQFQLLTKKFGFGGEVYSNDENSTVTFEIVGYK